MAKERSLAVERVETTGAEVFYRAAFLVANALGTAAGDYLSDELGVGFMHSAAHRRPAGSDGAGPLFHKDLGRLSLLGGLRPPPRRGRRRRPRHRALNA
jgi:hypothetical protein